MGERLLVYGPGGHEKLVAEILPADGQQVAGFVDDNPTIAGSAVLDVPIFPAAEWLGKNAGERLRSGSATIRNVNTWQIY